MLTTRNRIKSSFLEAPDVVCSPSSSLKAYYSSLGRPDWGSDIAVLGKSGFPETYKEYVRSDPFKKANKWNSIEHYKCFFDPDDCIPFKYDYVTPTYSSSGYWHGIAETKYLCNCVGDYLGTETYLDPLYVEREDGGFVPTPPGINTLVQQGLNALLPTIKSDLSIINSIIELKDFKSLPLTLTGMAEAAKNLGSLLNRPLNHFPRNATSLRRSFSLSAGKTLREVMQAAADGYLQSQFNLTPLLRDLTSIYNSLAHTEKVLRDFLNRQGRVQRRHFTFRWKPFKESLTEQTMSVIDLNHYRNVGGEIIYGGPQADNVKCVSFVPAYTATFHLEVEYNYSFTQFQLEHARVLALLDVLGFNMNPAILWNAIPWSFLVDWVFGVSRWLDNRKIIQMKPVINISRCLWSWSYDRITFRSLKSTGATDSPPLMISKLPSVYESAYRRDVSLPDVNSIILSGLNSSEFSLGVALAITRRRHPNNRGR